MSTAVESKTCTFKECGKIVQAKSYCSGHYKQLRAGKALSPLRKVSPHGAKRVAVQSGRKACTKCLETKPLTEFYSDRQTSDGLCCVCKFCKRGQVNSYNRRNPQRNRDRASAWSRNNLDKAAERNQRRRARKSNCYSEPYSRTEIFARWGGKCCYCDDDATALDHVTPIAKAGADAAFNLVPACAACNLSKGAKSLAEWALTFVPKIVS